MLKRWGWIILKSEIKQNKKTTCALQASNIFLESVKEPILMLVIEWNFAVNNPMRSDTP